MKREIIEDALSGIDEKYQEETLNILGNEQVSDTRRMNLRKIIVLGIAATFIFGLGIIASARGFFSMKTEEVDQEETFVVQYTYEVPAEIAEMTYSSSDETGESDEVCETIEWTNITIESEVMVYPAGQIDNMIIFEGPDQCSEIEVYPNYLPDGCVSDVGFNVDWTQYYKGFYYDDSGEHVVEIQVWYVPQLIGGGLITSDVIQNDSYIDGDYSVTELVLSYYGDDRHYALINCNQEEGYIICIGSDSMEENRLVFESLEIRQTNTEISYRSNGQHIYFYGPNGYG